jgi:hypothetical protein
MPNASGARRRDRSTLPCLAILLSGLLIVMGHSSGNPGEMWTLSAFLVGGSFVYVFLPRRGERSESAR